MTFFFVTVLVPDVLLLVFRWGWWDGCGGGSVRVVGCCEVTRGGRWSAETANSCVLGRMEAASLRRSALLACSAVMSFAVFAHVRDRRRCQCTNDRFA